MKSGIRVALRRVEFRRLEDLPAASQLRAAAAILRQLGRAGPQRLEDEERVRLAFACRACADDLEGAILRH